ncbi:hypothetical protein [Streptomyces sp. NPDC051364]|uniref:hypothetical protein n=1 Tax=Streptomyces sp. NPDC051364 TaxID=3155799 RepID=UPI0034408716
MSDGFTEDPSKDSKPNLMKESIKFYPTEPGGKRYSRFDYEVAAYGGRLQGPNGESREVWLYGDSDPDDPVSSTARRPISQQTEAAHPAKASQAPLWAAGQKRPAVIADGVTGVPAWPSHTVTSRPGRAPGKT